MYIWTSEEIQKILIQLNEKKLPFSKYSFSLNEGRLKLLGKGGFSSVYEAVDRKKPSKKFAIKVIGFGDKNVDSDFFYESTRMQQNLSYRENIIKVFDYKEILVWLDEENNVIETKEIWQEKTVADCLHLQFVVMERNEPVIARDKAGKLHLTPPWLEYPNEQEVLKLAYQIGKALLAAHESNVLHRDIKLENIFYSHKEECYKLGDFGIAKKTNDGTASTVACTKGYGAPEIIGSLDDKYDVTADIYSLGILLYVLLNELKFPDADSYQVNSKAQYQKGYVPPRPKHGSDALCAIIEKMCKFNPDDRYQSMDEVLNALEGIIYTPNLSLKRTHKSTYLLMGTLATWLGALVAKLTYLSEIVVRLNIWELLFAGCLVGKFICSATYKKRWPINLLVFLIGLVILFQSGFSWVHLLIFLLLLLFDSIPGILAGSILVIEVVSVLQTQLDIAIIRAHDFRWLALLFISIGIEWLLMHMFLSERDDRKLIVAFTDQNWLKLFCVIYVLIVIQGIIPSEYNMLIRMFGDFVTPGELLRIGGVGVAFCVGWNMREWWLKKRGR